MKTLSPKWQHVIMGQWIALATCMVAMVIMYTAFTRVAECQDTYMSRQYEAQTARAATAESERQSLKDVFENLVAGNREGSAEAITAHAKLLEENDKVRKDNPYPELPKSC